MLYFYFLIQKTYKKRQSTDIPVFCRFFMEAPPGFEPGIRVLQTRALPLGYIAIKIMEQVTGIGPVTKPWQGFILPLNYTCIFNIKF